MVEDRNSSRHDLNCWLGGKASTRTNKTNGRKREHSLTSRHKNTKEISLTRRHTYASTDSHKMVILALTSYLEKLKQSCFHACLTSTGIASTSARWCSLLVRWPYSGEFVPRCAFVCLFYCLTSQSTTMVMTGRSVHLHVTICNWQQPAKTQYWCGFKFFHVISMLQKNCAI